MAAATGVEVLDARERERYEIYVDGALAGFSEYKSRPRPGRRADRPRAGGVTEAGAGRAAVLPVRARLHRAPSRVRRARAGGLPGALRARLGGEPLGLGAPRGRRARRAVAHDQERAPGRAERD